MRSKYKIAGLSLMLLSALLFTLGLGSTAASAQPLGQQSGQTLTIAAGQQATLQVRGFCLDPNIPFPTGISKPDSLAADNVRAGLNYAVGKGYDQSDPRQVQEAVWYLQTGTWQSADHQLAQEIVNAASDSANAPSTPAGTSVIDAIKANNVTAEITFQPAPDVAPNEAYYGDGTLTIKNTGSQDIQVYLPFGSIFPPANTAEQRLVGYAVGAQVSGTPTAAATGTAGATAAATTTTAATAEATTSATAAATAEATASATAAATAEATNTVGAVATTAATETAAPTNTVAAIATTAPTEMPMETATTAPTETPMAVATETPFTPSLPSTGAGSTGGPGWLLLLGGVVALLAGFVLLRLNPSAKQGR